MIMVIDDGFDLFLTVLLYPTFAWEDAAYHLEKDPEQRTFHEILVDVIAADIIEPWGGGKWHLEVFKMIKMILIAIKTQKNKKFPNF